MAGSFGATVQFGDTDGSLDVDWKEYGFTDNANTVNTATIVQDGITFALTASTSANLDLNASGDAWGVNGGFSGTQLDYKTDIGPTESITFTLAVSGDTNKLTSLSFGGMSWGYFNNTFEQMRVGDGTTTKTLAGLDPGTSWVDYEIALSGLTALSLTNVASWQLDITALQSLDPLAGSSAILFSQVDLEYTISGEPTPIAIDDSYRFYSDIDPILSVAAPGVLENDVYSGTLELSALLAGTTTNGTLNLSTDGSFTYEADDPGFVGMDAFTYKAVTSATTSDTAQVTIIVTKEMTLLHYSFDTDLADSSGNGNDGSYAGTGGSITNASQFGSGSFLTAGSDYVAMADTLSFATEENWSISLWYNAATTNPASIAGNNLFNYSLDYNQNGGPERNYHMRGGHNSDQLTWVSSAADPSLDTDIWHHLVFTAQGEGNIVKAYEDGVELSPSWNPGDDTGMIFSWIGNTGIATNFNGMIDEVWIMNYALGANEVASLYSSNNLDGELIPAEIVGWAQENSNTMKMVVYIDPGADASQYSPKTKSNLIIGTWDPVAHSDSASGTYAVSNLTLSSAEDDNLVIYVTATNTVEFFNIQAE